MDKEGGHPPQPFVADDTKLRRWGWAFLALGLGGFTAWAALAPLDAGVSSPGTVVVSGNRKAVQALVGGRLVELRAKDGDQVQVGQLLARLDDTQARSQFDVAQGQWLNLLAVEARLQAERTDSVALAFNRALTEADPRASSAMALQNQLFRTRRRAYESELAGLRESIGGLQAQQTGLEDATRARQEQKRLLGEEIERQRDLVKDGFLPRNRLSEQERALAALQAALADDTGNLGRIRQQMAELQARMLTRQHEQRRDVETQLSDVQRDAAALTSRLKALEFELAATNIKSPAAGVVIGQAVHTVGGVVQAGVPMMEVVPAGEPLKIDVQIATHLIDKLHPGLGVDILFPAFQQSTTPHVPGRVLQVSADMLVDPKQGQPYFKAVVEVTPDGMRQLRDLQIRAGMPAEVFVRTGERTLLNYLVKPLTDRWRRGLTEP